MGQKNKITVFDTMVAKLMMEDYKMSPEKAIAVVQSVKEYRTSDMWDKDASEIPDGVLEKWYVVVRIQRRLLFP